MMPPRGKLLVPHYRVPGARGYGSHIVRPAVGNPGGVAVVNCVSRNTVKSDDADSVFQSSGTYKHDENGGTPKREACYLKFARPINSILGGLIRTTIITQPGGALSAAMNVNQHVHVDAGLIDEDFDITTLTWNNAPDAPTFGSSVVESLSGSFSGVGAGSPLVANNPGDVDLIFTIGSDLSIGSTAVGAGPFYGVYVYVSTDIVIGDNSDEFMEGRAEIADPLDRNNSSYIVEGAFPA